MKAHKAPHPPIVDEISPGKFYQYTGKKGSLLISNLHSPDVWKISYGQRLIALEDEEWYNGEYVIKTAVGYLSTSYFTPVDTPKRLDWQKALYDRYRASKKILTTKEEIDDFFRAQGWAQNGPYYRLHTYMDSDFLIEDAQGEYCVEELDFDMTGTLAECEDWLFQNMMENGVGIE